MGLLTTMNRTEVKDSINFIQDTEAKLRVLKINPRGIDFRKITDKSEKPAIASLLLDHAPLFKGAESKLWGSRILSNLVLINYLADAIGKTEEYQKLEEKYGANIVKKDGEVVTYEREWFEGDFTPQVAKQFEKDRRDFLKGVVEEGELAFTMKMEVNGENKPAVFSWETKDIDKLTEGLVNLFADAKEDLAKVGFTASLVPRGYKSTLIKSLVKI